MAEKIPGARFATIAGAGHLEATTSITLNGMTEDTWVVVLVRGTDDVSEPIFPVVPNNISSGSNPTLADLIDGNLGESGVPATAFSNPLFIDLDVGPPPAVGGIALDADLRSLPLETAGPTGSPWGVAVAVVAAASLVAVGGAAWYARQRSLA